MIDPGSIEGGIDGEPAVEEHHHRGAFRFRIGRLEQPVRAGPLPELETVNLAMRIPRGVVRPLTGRGSRDLVLRGLEGLQGARRSSDHGRRHQPPNQRGLSHPWRAACPVAPEITARRIAAKAATDSASPPACQCQWHEIRHLRSPQPDQWRASGIRPSPSAIPSPFHSSPRTLHCGIGFDRPAEKVRLSCSMP